jgi:hypothetical protein
VTSDVLGCADPPARHAPGSTRCSGDRSRHGVAALGSLCVPTAHILCSYMVQWNIDRNSPERTGWRVGQWGDHNYERACTPEEAELLDADLAAAEVEERSEDEQLRKAWFAMLRAWATETDAQPAGCPRNIWVTRQTSSRIAAMS